MLIALDKHATPDRLREKLERKGRSNIGAAFRFWYTSLVKHLSRKTEGLIAVNLSAVIFGSAALFGKLPISPCWIVAMRALFAAIALAILGSTRSTLRALPRAQLPSILSTGVLLAIHWVTFFLSVQLGGIAIATLTFAAFPLFTVLIECGRARRRMHIAEALAGGAIIVAAAALVDWRSTVASHQTSGVVAGLVCAVAFAAFGVASKRLTIDLSPLLMSMYQNIVVSAVLLPLLPFFRPVPHTGMMWIWLVLLGVVTTALMHQLYFYALQRLSASTCSGFIALEPVYAILFAAFLFHDSVTVRVLVAAALIIAASIALHRQEEADCQDLVDIP